MNDDDYIWRCDLCDNEELPDALEVAEQGIGGMKDCAQCSEGQMELVLE